MQRALREAANMWELVLDAIPGADRSGEVVRLAPAHV